MRRHAVQFTMIVALLAVVAGCSQDPDDAPPDAAPASKAPVAPVMPANIESLLKRDDTLATAKARLGDAAVVMHELDGAEGETFRGWMLYPDDPERSIEVVLDAAGEHPAAMLLRGRSSAWTRADGVGIGMTSAELQTLNGKPFGFVGFGWDYGGAVIDWRGGALGAGPDGTGPRGSVALCPPEQQPEDYPLGEQTYASDDPRLAAHPAIVCEYNIDVAR